MVHLSYCGDIPWRLYECAASKTCFLTDPLSFGVERLFVKGKDYIEFNRDLSNLEEKIKWLLENESIRKEITEHAYKTVKKYTWEKVSEELIFPLL